MGTGHHFLPALCRGSAAFVAIRIGLSLAALLGRESLLGVGANGRAVSTGTLARLPLTFEENRGQADVTTRFLSRGNGYTVFLSDSEAVFVLPRGRPEKTARALEPPEEPEILRVGFSGPKAIVTARGEGRLETVSNYFIGKDPAKWRTRIPNYRSVSLEGVYPSIDLVYYGDDRGRLEYDFVVRPGGDPADIELRYEGARDLCLDVDGDLVIHMKGGEIVQHRPLIYQEWQGQRQVVPGRFRLAGAERVRLEVEPYDTSRPLIVDPTLEFSTYLAYSIFSLYTVAIAVDPSGHAYVAGSYPDGVWVAKLNAAGTGLVYSTILGGAEVAAIAVDASGNAYVVGETSSTNFPTTPGAFQKTYGGSVGFSCEGGYGCVGDGFVTKLNATGTELVYSTYLGGSAEDVLLGIAVDEAGNAYVAGSTLSTDLPTTNGAFQTTFGGTARYQYYDAFVAKLNATGSALLYSTYLGGTEDDGATGIAVDASGNAYVTGGTGAYSLGAGFPTTGGAYQRSFGGSHDAFVTKLNATGTALVYSTYLGRKDADGGEAIAVDIAGNAYVAGKTRSNGLSPSGDFPTTPGAFQATHRNAGGGLYSTDWNVFVSKVDPTGSSLVYSTYITGTHNDTVGGSLADSGQIALDAEGNVWLAGTTSSEDFPTTPDAFQPTFRVFPGNASSNVFITGLNANGSALVYSTFLAGTGHHEGYGIALDGAGGIYVAGSTDAPDFPITPGAYRATASNGGSFVAKFIRASCPTITVSPPTLPPGIAGAAYRQDLSVTPAGTYTLTVTAGSVPPGLTLSGNVLSGTPTAGGSFHFTITASDAGRCIGSAAYVLDVVLPCPRISLSPDTLPAGTVGSSYGPFTLTPTAGTAPFTFNVGGLPPGMTPHNAVTGAALSIGGTPTITLSGTVAIDGKDSLGCPFSQSYSLTVNAPGTTGALIKVVPIVLDVAGRNDARFTSELTIANRGSTAARVLLTYRPAAALQATGGGAVLESLDAGRQMIIPDGIAYLRAKGLPIPVGSNQGGTLEAAFFGLSSSDVSYAGVRTTSAAGSGRAGLSYPAVRLDEGLLGDSYVYGLRETTDDRSNLALVNLSSSPVTLRVTVVKGGDGGPTWALPDLVLQAWQWFQYNAVLEHKATNGYAKIELVSGAGPYFAYGVINDNATNDGSFVPPARSNPIPQLQLLPVIVETPTFRSELVLSNPRAQSLSATLSYSESLSPPSGAGGIAVENLQPFEQKIIPNAIDYLRQKGVAIGSRGSSLGGMLGVTFASSGSPSWGFVGGKTYAPGDGGQYGLFYPATGVSEAVAGDTWIFGLQQSATSRSNVAVANVGDAADSISVRFDVFDGERGSLAGSTGPYSLAPGAWYQVSGILVPFGLANGYVRVVRVSGGSRMVVYGVVNDGASSTSGRTNDGSYVASSNW